ncbi:hypothetical protein C8R42DRAFT_367301 [Lentinula raphanica]|nr:hypothetical protein C8R42DRAFT_367301 [Lentinula raphanica]
MRRSLPLPNEILQSIAKYIAYAPKLRAELLPLSVVNWQLRRICLPFLFANIKISHDKDAAKLEEHLALCAKFTKTLRIGRRGGLTKGGDKIISRTVPQFEQLFNVKLPRCRDRTDLLKTILAHPTVTSVSVDEIPDVSMCDHDLSKVILSRTNSTSAFSSTFQKYLDQGMTLTCLKLEIDCIDGQLESRNFPGLEAIELEMLSEFVSFSWLAPFSSAHPTLNELSLLKIEQDLFGWHDAPPFLSSLAEEIRRQSLNDCFEIWELRLRRSELVGQSTQEWHVVTLALKTITSSIETLTLFASSFPQLKTLTLSLGDLEEMFDADDLASVLARFSSLKVIYLENIYGRVTLKPDIEKLPPIQRDDTANTPSEFRAYVESEILTIISRLVKQAKSLDSVHIEDTGYEYDDSDDAPGSWDIEGWLRVLNGNRDIGGELVNQV